MKYSQFLRSPFKKTIYLSMVFISLSVFSGCQDLDQGRAQGYVEGEYVYVSSSFGGMLKALHVERGKQVQANQLLFELENESEKASLDEADHKLAQARATLEDTKKGRRSSEIEAMEAELHRARAQQTLSEKELARQEKLVHTTGAISEYDYDRFLSKRDEAQALVSKLEAELKTAQLGSRPDQVAAAEAELHAREAGVVKAKWALEEKQQSSLEEALVFDTLYREGEWVPPGRPVVMLLPPQNIKVRAFISEKRMGSIHVGDVVTVYQDGASSPFTGQIRFISPQSEYTPPVIYSKENREKMVFMIEIEFDPTISKSLHPGQPVDVQF